ncbi:OsmC family protein [Caulobacter segnis]|uniref:OsmC family protein n=1 Tax=Caulobacter segnis TaxID=88688 RepID=UPI00240FA16C|nr:OsmC family protein [Caulobacter segnis]MDG2520659.1 OsmC family protein [Caulobacter segnis]
MAVHARASVAETGQSPYAVRMDIGGHAFVGDESLTAGGGGLGPSPFEMLSAALAECTAMTLRWYANQQGWPVERIEVAVDYSKKVVAGASSPVDAFEKTILIHGVDLTDEQRTRLLNVAAKCPVQRTLESAPLITTLVGVPPDPAA